MERPRPEPSHFRNDCCRHIVRSTTGNSYDTRPIERHGLAALSGHRQFSPDRLAGRWLLSERFLASTARCGLPERPARPAPSSAPGHGQRVVAARDVHRSSTASGCPFFGVISFSEQTGHGSQVHAVQRPHPQCLGTACAKAAYRSIQFARSGSQVKLMRTGSTQSVGKESGEHLRLREASASTSFTSSDRPLRV